MVIPEMRCVLTLVLSLSSVHSLASPSSQQESNRISFGTVLRNNDRTSSNSRPIITSDNNKNNARRKWQYWCDNCACGFNKLKSYNQHIAGKSHCASVEKSESLWMAYGKSGPVYYDPSVAKQDVTRAWSLDLFMDGLQARSRSSIKHTLASGMSNNGQIDPRIRLCDLSPQKRASLWRYLYTTTSVPDLAGMVGAVPSRFVRVKELLESIEIFLHVERLMKRSVGQGHKARRYAHIYDVGCGHGLVGMLCAAAFPNVHVHAIDIVPRESFQAQRDAFRSTGNPITNLTFEAGDLTNLLSRKMGADGEHGLLLCVHGCKSLTHESIELAESKLWAWLSVPCCLQLENHLDDRTTLKVSDETRFTMLCGAIATKYKPETVTSIDARITARGIVLASSGTT